MVRLEEMYEKVSFVYSLFGGLIIFFLLHAIEVLIKRIRSIMQIFFQGKIKIGQYNY